MRGKEDDEGRGEWVPPLFRGHGLANITSEERKKELNFEMVTPREHIL